jgi:hypothetical protein
VVKRLCVFAIAAGLACAAAGCGASRAVHGSRFLVSQKSAPARFGPFRVTGFAGGGSSGLQGDGASGPKGTSLGCVDRRRYSQAFGLQNSSKLPVTLTGARGANPAPDVIGLVAIQLRLSPRARPTQGQANLGGPAIDLLYHGWSRAPTRPVTIPPGRSATVQTNYLLRNCNRLAHGWSVVVPGLLVLRYRISGHVHRRRLSLAGERIVLSAGPTRRTCAPVPGSARLVAADLRCAAARRATVACHPLSHSSWGDCRVSGVLWDCGRFAGPGSPLLETCYLPQRKSHWFSTVWIAKDLTLWGAFAGAHGRSLSGGAGACELGGRALRYRSQPIPLGGSFGVARVRLSVAGYRGPGDYGAHDRAARTEIEVVIHGSRAKGAPSGSYDALAGRVVVSGTTGPPGGAVYASLGLRNGARRIDLNGTWRCRAA